MATVTPQTAAVSSGVDVPTSVPNDATLPASTVANVGPAKTSQSIDPIAVLKRVENLRKWQEEEHKKLFQAHEDQMQQLRMQQERHSKLLTNNFTNLAANPASNSTSSANLVEQPVSHTSSAKLNLADKINMLTQEFKQKKYNLQYNYNNEYDDDEDDDEEDEESGHSLEEEVSQEESRANLTENDLIELIRRQIKQKNFKLDTFVDNYDEMNDEDRLG